MINDKYGRICPADTVFLLVDVQEKFVPHILNIDVVIANCVRLVEGCRELGVPVVVTEQYPKGLGPTVEPIKKVLGDVKILEKTSFSVFGDAAIAAELKARGRHNILLAGIESHVCLIKSALDALDTGHAVHWITDAISSRTRENADAARRRALQCGAFSSSAEMALFQLMDTAGDPAFRAISKIVK